MVGKEVSTEYSAVRIRTPLKKEDILSLKVGDMVIISGQVVTGRDRVHKFLFNERPHREKIPFNLDGSILYHCGPIIRKVEDGYKLIAGGPTTSIRVEMYEHWVIKEYGIKAVMGKGGMGRKTLDALKECGCVYLHTISGAAVYLADRVKMIVDGWKVDEFGMPEAMWLLEVENFPAIVTMDAHGNSLHRDVESLSSENLKKLLL
ncbi:MAG: hypothetical protein OHK0032_13340 [Thermodesulfovibrionales bacterium]